VAKPSGGRFGRLFRSDGDETDDESVAMSGNDDHAWWADRRTLAGAPGRSTQPAEQPVEPPPTELFTDPPTSAPSWSVDALFADAGFDPTDTVIPPPTEDDGSTTVVAAGLDEARLLLGVTSGASPTEITKAHRALAMQFHPDRLGDLSPEAQELGQQRMAEINRAYDTIRGTIQV
jgi:DnaJ-domain-containing protein 1